MGEPLTAQQERLVAISKYEAVLRNANCHSAHDEMLVNLCRWARESCLAQDATGAPLGYVLVEIATINELCERIKGLIAAGSADARSIADVATLLLVATLPRG